METTNTLLETIKHIHENGNLTGQNEYFLKAIKENNYQVVVYMLNCLEFDPTFDDNCAFKLVYDNTTTNENKKIISFLSMHEKIDEYMKKNAIDLGEKNITMDNYLSGRLWYYNCGKYIDNKRNENSKYPKYDRNTSIF